MTRRLGIGFIGSGFITRFHIRSWEAVRDADVRGVWSPTRAHAEEAAALARELRVGDARAFDSIEAMVADDAIDAIWICGPNFARVDNMSRIVSAIKAGASLRAVACERPLARNVAEARRMVELAEDAGVLHGYLENQLFQRVRALVRALLAMNGQIRQVPRCGSGVCLIAKNLRHHFKHLSEAVAKNDFRSPRRWGDLAAYTVVPPLHDGRYQIVKPLGRKILRHEASRLESLPTMLK